MLIRELISKSHILVLVAGLTIPIVQNAQTPAPVAAPAPET
jgi:hypothetical protein